MSDTNAQRELYQEVLLDHYKRPRNHGPLPSANRIARGENPLCGDRLSLRLEVTDGRIAGIAFEGEGCAISTASASLMTEAVRGQTPAQAESLFERFHALLTKPSPPAPGEAEALGKLAIFEGVRDYPVRVKCATLPWHTLRAALAQRDEPVTTE